MKRLPLMTITLSLFGMMLPVGLGMAVAGTASESSEADWQRTVAAAKKEGQVVIYTSSNQNNMLLESGAFQKRFPEIKLIVAFGDPTVRIPMERRAGKYLADVAFTGPGSLWELYLAKLLEPITDAIILPEVADQSKWFGGKHQYVDPEGKYIFAAVGNVDSGAFFYNTKLVKPKEFRSFWDFLRPELKGKMAARDTRTSGPGSVTMRFFYHLPALGPAFLSRLYSEMDITLFRDQRQGVDWLATGKYPICIFCNNTMVEAAKVQGLPVDTFDTMKEGAGLIVSGGAISLVNRAPHPNAAKVFINWFLSREGQIALQSTGAGGTTNSRRIDIPKEMVEPTRIPQKGVHYLDADTWERISMEPVVKVLNAALAEAEKRRKR